MNNTGIYKIISKTNSKMYIGSAVNFIIRWRTHKYTLKKQNHKNILLQNHVNKYGIEDLEFSIVEICTKNDLITREQYWINEYNPAFNICKIAGNSLGFKYSKKQKLKLSYSHNPKRVYQYNLKGEFIKDWRNTQEVCDHYNCDYSGINKCCIGTLKSFIGYIWRYIKTDDLIPYINNHIRKIEQYDVDFNFLRSFSSIKEAGKFMEVKASFICTLCKKKKGTCKNFYFKYEEDDIKELINNNKKIMIYIFDINKKLIYSSTDRNEIMKKFDIKTPDKISRHLNKKKNKPYKNLYFSYENII